MSVSLSLPSMHHKKYYYSMLPCLQRVPCAILAPPTVPHPIYGRLFKMGVYLQRQSFYPGRLNKMGVYSRRAFNHGIYLV